jgi:hypothetical protein
VNNTPLTQTQSPRVWRACYYSVPSSNGTHHRTRQWWGWLTWLIVTHTASFEPPPCASLPHTYPTAGCGLVMEPLDLELALLQLASQGLGHPSTIQLPTKDPGEPLCIPRRRSSDPVNSLRWNPGSFVGPIPDDTDDISGHSLSHFYKVPFCPPLSRTLASTWRSLGFLLNMSFPLLECSILHLIIIYNTLFKRVCPRASLHLTPFSLPYTNIHTPA